MAKNNLKEISGEKIRQQYFNLPIYILTFAVVSGVYSVAIFDLISLGKIDFPELGQNIMTGASIWLILSVPFVIFSVLNRSCFGKVICVLNEAGIYYKDGFIKWCDIDKVEYEIRIPGHSSKMNDNFCSAVLYTKGKSTELLHAPLYILSRVKKHSPETDVKISKSSRFILIVCLIFVVAAPPVMFILKSRA